MQEIWQRIESWLQAKAPDLRVRLLPGATDEQVRSAEALLQVKLPSDVQESFRIHNGQHELATALMGSWQLFSLRDLTRDWQTMKDLYDAGKFSDVSTIAIGPVRAAWWHPNWIPLAHNGAGDLQCADMDPAQGGTVGQIISFWHMSEERRVLASSFRGWLEEFADDLEAGQFEVKRNRLVRLDRG